MEKRYFFGKWINPLHVRAWGWFCNRLFINKKTDNWEFIAFDFDDMWSLIEFDLSFSGYGCFSEGTIDGYRYTRYERTILHFVLFRTKFAIRKKWKVKGKKVVDDSTRSD